MSRCQHHLLATLSADGECGVCATEMDAQMAAAPMDEVALEASVMRDDLYAFAVGAWPLLTGVLLRDNVAAGAMAAVLQAIADGRLRRTLIEIAPGTGKSTWLVTYAAWRLARDPSHRAIHASHSFDLTARDSRRVRRLVESQWFRSRFGARLREDESTIGAWATTDDGRYIAVGVNGSLTGHRAGEAVVDDPMNAVDRFSKAARESLWSWFTEALSTRLDGENAPITVVAQRLDVDDLLGKLRETGAWTCVTLPAEFDPERRCVAVDDDGVEVWRDPRTQDGELLAPDTLSREKLAELRRTIGSAALETQYNENPSDESNAAIKVGFWRYFREANAPAAAQPRPRDAWTGLPVELPRKLSEVVIACDLGFKGGAHNDNTAMVVIGIHQADRFVLDLVARPMEFTEQIATLLALRKKWPQVRRILIEDSANAAALKSELGRKVSGLKFVPARDSKLSRIMACSPAIESGNVFVRDGAAWVDELVHEAAAVPGGRRDDRIDALALGLNSTMSGSNWATATRAQLERKAERVEAQRAIEQHPERCIRCAPISDMQLVQLLGDVANLAGNMRASTCPRCCDLADHAAGWRPVRRKRYLPVKPRDRDRGSIDESPTQRGFAFLPRQK